MRSAEVVSAAAAQKDQNPDPASASVIVAAPGVTSASVPAEPETISIAAAAAQKNQDPNPASASVIHRSRASAAAVAVSAAGVASAAACR